MEHERKPFTETPAEAAARFEIELDFVQSLANPKYLEYLAQRKYFADKRFVAYLKYLQYWRSPEYAVFLAYPHALFFLEHLLNPAFRFRLEHDSGFAELLHAQQVYLWTHNAALRQADDAEALAPATSALAPLTSKVPTPTLLNACPSSGAASSALVPMAIE
ncbi:mediator complex subunit SOH1 [Thecamonas trahens ATCC 50062]|uniref:Mediator of RNA polymerase II transcription subunit 31 n=1 Tax=Thecamonas trahens ATCC 50062 TaxID=461836 RepID=A0A0L0D415_THETB|nr:mediator complex subunit SOH1 [Thecamonas trahens ATCC 50062]KNC46053.1 mediator complex subunit SOH1 [Thecamonas trahens ATCC 50062]|eukprot:XP_013763033.1 mediator complex subunit SOH1 [Thecamonas trahens ATCC 50062]